jgi:hypothetical protein
MQFRLATIVYLFALLVVSLGAFGNFSGALAAFVVTSFWIAIFKQPRTTVVEWLVLGFIGLVFLGLSLPNFLEGREYARLAHCRNCLQQIVRSLQSEVLTNGRLPQAIIRDPQERALHSWRVSLLPHIDENATHQAYDWSQPWNGPSNRKGMAKPIDILRCPSDPSASPNAPQTNYFAIVGPQTAWPVDHSLTLGEISDDLGGTILLLEASGLNVAWGEPRDLTFDDALKLLSEPTPGRVVHQSYKHPGFSLYRDGTPGVHAAFADGTVRFLPVPLPEEMAKALLTANASDEVDWDEFERLTAPQLDYAKIYATIAFAIVALWPARRLLRKRPA